MPQDALETHKPHSGMEGGPPRMSVSYDMSPYMARRTLAFLRILGSPRLSGWVQRITGSHQEQGKGV